MVPGAIVPGAAVVAGAVVPAAVVGVVDPGAVVLPPAVVLEPDPPVVVDVVGVLRVVQPLVTVAMLMWGVVLIKEGQISGGSLVGAMMFAGRAVSPLTSVVTLASRYQGAKAALMVLNELIAYSEMSKLPLNSMAERSRLIMTYALCGFANVASVGLLMLLHAIAGIAIVYPLVKLTRPLHFTSSFSENPPPLF